MLANVLEVLVRLLTPIISFTTEEVWQNYPKGLAESQDHPISVQLAGWPERGNFVPLIPEHEAERIEKRFEVVLAFRDEVTKALEEKRVEKTINKSQEAVVRATVPQAEYDVLTDFSEGFFEELLIVSKVAFERGDELTVEISVSDLDKCPRCWNFRVLGGNPHHPMYASAVAMRSMLLDRIAAFRLLNNNQAKHDATISCSGWWSCFGVFATSSEAYMEAHTPSTALVPVIDGVVGFRLVHNFGAAWGSFSGMVVVLVIVSIVLCAIILAT